MSNDVWMQRIGRTRAGRLLDGREWSEFPAPRGADEYCIAELGLAAIGSGAP